MKKAFSRCSSRSCRAEGFEFVARGCPSPGARHSALKTRVNALKARATLSPLSRGEGSRQGARVHSVVREGLMPAATPADMLVARRPFDGDVRDVLDVPAAPRFARRGDRLARHA